ncbi:hypothetical protein CROQUDRAFT_719805 [Cronartium quercuum f. sp. fusiforme G11]|uniref:Uncharacterized protein n=1 Tax=Cronartium quercuum f. sp. fusiforme G11 TaxID=708437 RepID=A0A9P6NQR7_9BASI|nr:hypothetical protein CROQUDRAFT_719805 [Cronartium quercuum f. sp. fusiforme G11]
MSPTPNKTKRPHRPEYAHHVEGASIYTCMRYQSHYNEAEEDDFQIDKRFSRRFKRRSQLEDGPWYMDLENVLKRRDESRELRLKREQRKQAVKKIKRAHARSRSVTVNSQQDSENSDGHEHEEPTMNTPRTPRPGMKLDEEHKKSSQPTNMGDTEPIRLPEEIENILPSSSLLSSIHHTAASLYTEKEMMELPPSRPGRKPKTWREPVAMVQSLHGSALMAIGILLEEMLRQDKRQFGEARAE